MANSASCRFFLANMVTLEGELGAVDSDFLTDLRLEESDIFTAIYKVLVTGLVTGLVTSLYSI